MLRKPIAMGTADFAGRIAAVGRRLAEGGPCSVYLPDEVLDAVRSPFLKATSFDAIVDLDDRAWPPRAFDPELEPGLEVYRVEERHLKIYPRDWADGQESPGLFLVSPVRRAPALDRAAFDAYWRDRHGPLALRHHTGMWDYRQALVVEPIGEGSTPWDGIARLGFPSVTSFETSLFDSREGRRAIAEDTGHFVDVADVRLLREIVLAS